jgi:glycosyltransferase involved in cell wall biosynthesis
MGLKLLLNYGKDYEIVPDIDVPMEGAKTAAIELAISLASRGHDVHLFAPCRSPGLYQNVYVHDRKQFQSFEDEHELDALILIEGLLPLLMPTRARSRIVWSHNAFRGGDPGLLRDWPGESGRTVALYPVPLFASLIDRLIVASEWQAEVKASVFPPDRISVRYLGVRLERFEGKAPARTTTRLVYTSNPRKGLDVLLQIFPRIRARVANADLHVFAANPIERADQIVTRGRVSKTEMARELMSAGLMAYPNTIKETFSLAVAEAQAAGLPVVTSDRGALSERVSDGDDGVLVSGDPHSSQYQERFVDASVMLLEDSELASRMGEAGRSQARARYDWRTIAAEWEAEILSLTSDREPVKPELNAGFNLLDPLLLQVAGSEADDDVPPAIAATWLREVWASYGYVSSRIPGLPDR